VNNTNAAIIGFVAGITVALSSTGIAQVRATVNTNGVLVGYIVKKNGKEVCRNPTVQNQFRGPDSYILC